MGHQRIGRLPRTRHWNVLIGMLDGTPQAAAVAGAAIRAAQERLAQLKDETAVPYCYWLLVRLTTAAHGGDFAGDASAIGVSLDPSGSMIGFIARLSGDVADALRRQPGAGPFAELAVESLRATLLDTIAVQGQLPLGDQVAELQRAFRTYATEAGFATLAQRYFGDFVGRMLRYFLDREIADHIGPTSGLVTVDDAWDFADALDLHARETARIMRDFAGEWYSKRNWLTGDEISREMAAGFVAIAIDK